MSCVSLSVGIHRKIRRIVLPTLVGSMTLVSAIAVVLGWETTGESLGAERWGRLVSDYFWITFWVVVAAVTALGFGLVLVWRLSRSIASPLTSLARRAESLTERGGAAHFPTDTRICEIDQLSAAFNRLLAVQEQQAIELRDLIRNVLHDIRAPISHISQQAECIFDGSCDPKKSAGLITEYCDTVIRLFETHAEIARNNAGAETLQPARQNLTDIISFVAELYQPVAEMKGVRLSVQSPADPIFFLGHKGKLERMIGNLTDNAVKFTPTGGSIVITSSVSSTDVEITVSDTGIGIQPESVPHVFDRYFRDESATVHSGCGLGLTLVRSIVTFYRGTIACKSEPGRGSAFTIRLPIAGSLASPQP